MNIENNKMQVDIENLFKQNVNDLSSIKELYRKLKEMEEKILQIKYIDNTLAKKLKNEYEKLKKIILDENVQVELNNKIEETKTELNEVSSQMNNITNNKVYFDSVVGVNDDERLENAITTLKVIGGTIYFSNKKYTFNNTHTISERINLEGVATKGINSNNGTIMEYTGVDMFLIFNSYYDRRSIIKNISFISANERKGTALTLRRDSNIWGCGVNIDNVVIQNFNTGIEFNLAYSCNLSNVTISNCVTGMKFRPYFTDTQTIDNSMFGNKNLIQNCTIFSCDFGVALLGDMQNLFQTTTIEQCIIAILTHSQGNEVPSPQGHVFENCWFEYNGVQKGISGYVVCNCSVDKDFVPTNTNKVSIPRFTNARDIGNVFPQIPTMNLGYNTFRVRSEKINLLTISDDKMSDIVNLNQDDVFSVKYGANSAHRKMFNISNKGTEINYSFNTIKLSKTISEPVNTETTETINIDYSRITKKDTSDLINRFSSNCLMNVIITFNDFTRCIYNFLITDFHSSVKPFVCEIGSIPNVKITSITVANSVVDVSNNKSFDIQVIGSKLSKIDVTLIYLPNGLF